MPNISTSFRIREWMGGSVEGVHSMTYDSVQKRLSLDLGGRLLVIERDDLYQFTDRLRAMVEAIESAEVDFERGQIPKGSVRDR